MKIKIIGTISSELKEKLNSIDYQFVKESSEAEYVIITSKVGSYFLNTTVGSIIEDAYNLEFTFGKPLVFSEKEFLQQKLHKNKETQI